MSQGKQKKTTDRAETERRIYKKFGNRFSQLLDIEYPNQSYSFKAFEVLKKTNPDKASECISSEDKRSNTRSIRAWMNGNSMPDSKADLLDICDLLNCEPGFLLGTQDEPNRGTTDAASETGLNKKSIKHLKNYHPEIKRLLDKLILHDGDNLLKMLQAVYTYALEAQHSVIRLEIPGADLFETQDTESKLIQATAETGNTLPDISKRMLKYAATTAFDEVLLDTYDDYIEDGNALLKDRIDRNADNEKKKWDVINEKRKRGWNLTPDELRILYGGTIDGDMHSKIDETFRTKMFEKIDKKAASLYSLYKNKNNPRAK